MIFPSNEVIMWQKIYGLFMLTSSLRLSAEKQNKRTEGISSDAFIIA